MSFAILDVDHFKEVNDRFGHAAGDEVLRRLAGLLGRTFRSEDIVSRWGGEEFVVGMYGMPRESGVQRLADALEAFRQERIVTQRGDEFTVTFSGGVAQFPDDGRDVAALYRAADAALYLAKKHGRDRVLPAGWQPDESSENRIVDVVVIDDDDLMRGLLQYALDTRGYRTRSFANGRTALDALTGPTSFVRTRLILLDVDLPDLDGFAVLKRLTDERVTRETKVIMLTAQSDESEVLRAFESGAVDHVVKPFSLPVLLQRIRRTLEMAETSRSR